jgi:hypothetical protein
VPEPPLDHSDGTCLRRIRHRARPKGWSTTVPGRSRFSLEVGQAHCVACITDLIVKKDLINLDFADVRAAMSAMGKAMMEPERLPATRARISAFGPSASKFLAGRHVNVPIGRVD